MLFTLVYIYYYAGILVGIRAYYIYNGKNKLELKARAFTGCTTSKLLQQMYLIVSPLFSVFNIKGL